MRTLKLLILLISAAIPAFAAWLHHHVNDDIQLPSTPYQFSIEQGSSLKKISQQLTDAGILSTPWSFILLSRYKGQQSSLKAGDYTLTNNISQVALLDYLVKGDAQQFEIKFIEGWTFSQLRNVLYKHPAIQNDTINLSEEEILQLIGANEISAKACFSRTLIILLKTVTTLISFNALITPCKSIYKPHGQPAWNPYL